jgi:hypothetical protein
VSDVWTDRIEAAFPNPARGRPASEEELDAVEASLGNRLPADLRSLLRETNGVKQGDYGYDLLWPAARIQADNMTARTSAAFRAFMPLLNLLFFADAGNGDMFGFAVEAGGDVRDDIYSWDHEDDSREWAAPDLATFLEWFAQGKIAT